MNPTIAYIIIGVCFVLVGIAGWMIYHDKEF
jgi:hypothetical protein